MAGLKENVIIGKLIPAATGLRHYSTIEIEPAEDIPRQSPEDIDMIDQDELAAELGLTDGNGRGESVESLSESIGEVSDGGK